MRNTVFHMNVSFFSHKSMGNVELSPETSIVTLCAHNHICSVVYMDVYFAVSLA